MADSSNLADAWLKAGTSFTAAQEQFFKGMAQQMGGPFTTPFQAFAGTSPDLTAASDNLRKVMDSSRKLMELLAPADGRTGMQDGANANLLQKIFDPREWLSATGYMDENVRRMTEGPRLADLGQFERKFLVLMNAWSEVRTQSARHSSLVLEAWSRAAEEFSGKLNAAVGNGASMGSRAQTVDLWVEIANRHLLEAQRSAPFLRTQRDLLRASSALRIAQKDIGDAYNEMLGMPTRAEIDDLSRTVTELKREIRSIRRPRRPAREAATSKP